MALLRLVLWYVSLTTPLVENEHNIFSSKCGECISFTRSGKCFHGNGSHQICKACCLYQNYTTTCILQHCGTCRLQRKETYYRITEILQKQSDALHVNPSITTKHIPCVHIDISLKLICLCVN